MAYASYSDRSGSLRPLRVEEAAMRDEAASYRTNWSLTFLTMQKLGNVTMMSAVEHTQGRKPLRKNGLTEPFQQLQARP